MMVAQRAATDAPTWYRGGMRKHQILLYVALAACDGAPRTSQANQFELTLGNAGEVFQLAAGDNDDWTLPMGNTKVLIIPHASGSTITGFDGYGYEEGDALLVRNQSLTAPIQIAHQHSGSLEENRLYLPNSQDMTLGPQEAIFLDRDATLGAWSTWTWPKIQTVTTTTPSRSLNSAFQPSTTRSTHVRYSVRVTSTLTLTTGERGRVELRCDVGSPPTTVRGRVAGGVTGALAVGLDLEDTAEGQLTYLAAPGDNCLIQSVDEVGTPSYSITAQVEQAL